MLLQCVFCEIRRYIGLYNILIHINVQLTLHSLMCHCTLGCHGVHLGFGGKPNWHKHLCDHDNQL